MAHTSESPISHVTLHRLRRHRRASSRRPMTALVEVITPKPGSGVTLNVSEGGLRVAVDCPLRVDEICLLRVDDFSGTARLRRARVVWSRELPDDGWIAGLQIVGLH